ncbi:BURP domain-containing protein 5-like [Euphorbia lathyris]|uniref:BURP domain-containing protein 5-like n=1 Tax=Euphorbia lathyris TaxID=212925 RepID=UPI003313ED3E
MEIHHLLPLLALLFLCPRGTDASSSALPAQLYWKSMLPFTPLPKALQELIKTDAEIRTSFTEELFTVARGTQIKYRIAYWAESKTFDHNKSTFNTTTTTYFLRDHLRPYTNLSNVIFIKSPKGFNFLSRKLSESIPFSTSKLSQILNFTSIQTDSKEAKIIKQTIEECEAPGIKGEDKHCATSLESLVDYVVSKLGTRVKTVSNKVEEENKKQDYVIQKGIKMMGEKDRNIVCHKERYAYAVYYCHMINDTNVYVVPMRGGDGSKVEVVVVCHLDTSTWNPQHYAFQVLNVKLGGPPICHFVNSDTIVWIPN